MVMCFWQLYFVWDIFWIVAFVAGSRVDCTAQ